MMYFQINVAIIIMIWKLIYNVLQRRFVDV